MVLGLAAGCAAPPKQPADPPINVRTEPTAPAATEAGKKKGFDLFGLLLAPVTIPIDLLKGPDKPRPEPSPVAAAIDTPRDPQPAVEILFKVDVYQLTLPLGAVSQNAEFWNRLNEQMIDPARYDVLQRNGIRVGEASFSDWEYFRGLIDQHPGTLQQVAAVGQETRNLELPMRKDIPFQNVFYFDARNTLIGRSFDRSDNLINVSFSPAPRKPGFMRLSLAPVVRSQRKRLDFNLMNNEVAEVQFVSPEMFYDCSLRVDVPLESFIVVAPSPDAATSSSIGNAFLVKDGSAERQEQVLIIVPRPFRVK